MKAESYNDFKITVFTTTYNRAHTLPQLYESLLRQTSKNFCWLVVDDGSTDNTSEMVNEWANASIVPIKYVYKKNGGMLSGHNTAYDHIETELNVCIDSDDFMPDDAVEKILSLWDSVDSENVAGIVGLDASKNGAVIGTKFPVEGKPYFFHEIWDELKVKGDKKYVYRTEIINEFPRYPSFPGEKFPAQGYLYRLI